MAASTPDRPLFHPWVPLDPALAGTLFDGLNGIAVRRDLPETEALITIWNEAKFEPRRTDSFSTTAVETEELTRLLDRLIIDHRIDLDAPIVDLGCADGRLTRLLLEMGATKIIASDLSVPACLRLQKRLSSHDKERVQVLADDALHLPLLDNSIGFCVAWGLFAETGMFNRAFRAALRWLHADGLMLIAEPLLEQALLYALIMDDLDEMQRTLATRSRARLWDQKDRRYALHTESELEALMAAAPVEIFESGGISIFPSVMIGGMAQRSDFDSSKRDRLLTLCRALTKEGLRQYRQRYWLVGKKQVDGEP